jgi:phosphohistidine phosphatase
VIYLLRHGDADQDAKDDASRRLTEKGERQADIAGRALAALGVKLDACLSSPKVRAEQTARIACRQLGLACEHLDVEVEIAEQLRGGPFDAAELAAGRGEVMLVGHEPDLSGAVAVLTGGRIKLRKGGLAVIEDGLLHDLLRPKELRRIAGA